MPASNAVPLHPFLLANQKNSTKPSLPFFSAPLFYFIFSAWSLLIRALPAPHQPRATRLETGPLRLFCKSQRKQTSQSTWIIICTCELLTDDFAFIHRFLCLFTFSCTFKFYRKDDSDLKAVLPVNATTVFEAVKNGVLLGKFIKLISPDAIDAKIFRISFTADICFISFFYFQKFDLIRYPPKEPVWNGWKCKRSHRWRSGYRVPANEHWCAGHHGWKGLPEISLT